VAKSPLFKIHLASKVLDTFVCIILITKCKRDNQIPTPQHPGNLSSCWQQKKREVHLGEFALFLLNIYAIYACARMLNYGLAKTVTIAEAGAFVKLTAACRSEPFAKIAHFCA